MVNLRRRQATDIIREHFEGLQRRGPGEDVLVSAREAGRRMVEIYRLLTNEMPQAPGIEVEYHGDELPAVEFASPTERDPNETYYVITGERAGEPDVMIKGDQDGNEESNTQKGITQEGEHKSLGEGQSRRSDVRLLKGPGS